MSSVLDEKSEEWIAKEIRRPNLSPDGTSSESLNEKVVPVVSVTCINFQKINIGQPKSSQAAPLSSVSSLPPLPDLIPLRKANLTISALPNQIPAVSSEVETSSQQSKETEKLGSVGQANGGTTKAASDSVQLAKQPRASSKAKINRRSTVGKPTLLNTDDNHLVASAESNASNKNTNTTTESDQPSAMQELQPDQPMVQHRKSDRRRVGRDIFFFFEEHPANRRKGRQTKRAPQKRGRPPSNRSQPAPRLQLPTKKEALTTPDTDSTPTTPRVNPIFLWVKQDDTRIVEVRCEDYDKRNRIRLTKTPNGWRAIPRTDPTSSRVVKLLPNPMVHVKQEPKPDLLQSTTAESDSSKVAEGAAAAATEEHEDNTKKNKKKKKKKKREHDKEPEEKEEEEDAKNEENKNNESSASAVSMIPLSEIPKILSPAPADIVIYESTNHERNESEQDEPMETNPSGTEDSGPSIMEPNNNESTVDLTKNLTQISDAIEINMPQFIMSREEAEPEMILCPETGEFRRADQVGAQPTATVDLTNSEPDLHESFDVDTKHLKELLDSEDLLSHCDNGLTGAELIDSLVQRGCEDNHISEEDQHQIKETICLTDDFENEEEEILMRPEPVEDIISRLGESLTASPKCLSFNEAGEIEGLHGELFQNSSNQSDPFNSRNTLEELSITIKDLEPIPPKTTVEQVPKEAAETTTIVSPDSCVDELPKDLTCKKGSDNANLSKAKEHGQTPLTHQAPQLQPQRTNSRSSDAIQSPQPSGLPAVPPSPDIVHSNKTKSIFLDQLLNQNSISPKICSSVTVTPVSVMNSSTKVAQQKEPLDLGKHRKSASPTVSCSEEAKQSISSDEPVHKRIKTEPVSSNDPKEVAANGELAALLQPAKDPDPLTQLRLLISNPEWKVPDPILVPKDRLSAVLASPAREIPLLLTTRPELRLPEAFAYPSILQDPDILVISMAQLEAILQKQVEVARPKPVPQPQVTIEPVTRPRQEKSVQQHEVDNRAKQNNILNPLAPLMAPALANDIDAATLAAFNQMFWLPYLSQMAPDLFKAMAGLPNSANLAELLPFLAQQQQQQQQQQQKLQQQQQHQQRNLYNSQFNANTMPFQNPLELAMWQEALQQAQMQQALKHQRENQPTHKKPATPAEPKPNSVAATLLAQKQQQQQQQQQKNRTSYGMNPFTRMPNRQNSTNSRSDAAQFLSPSTKSTKQPQQSHQSHQQTSQSNHHSNGHNEQKPRVTLKSLSNLLEPDRLVNQTTDPKISVNNLMAMPGFDFTQNQQLAHQQQQQFAQFGLTAGSVSQLQQQQQLSHQQSQQQQHSQPQPQQQQQQMQGKLKVKPGAHLLDPAAVNRRLLNYEEPSEVGSTTNGMEDMMNDPNAPLWHPLFTSNQKTGYTSPWQWTTVTATGE